MTSQNQACQCDDSGDKYDVTYFLPIEIHCKRIFNNRRINSSDNFVINCTCKFMLDLNNDGFPYSSHFEKRILYYCIFMFIFTWEKDKKI